MPISAPNYSTTWTDVRIGGTISNASFVLVRNALTGSTTEGFVFYNQGHGTWFADIQGLALGGNMITAIADSDGTAARTASATITVIRPLQPADLIVNGTNQASANISGPTGVHSTHLTKSPSSVTALEYQLQVQYFLILLDP